MKATSTDLYHDFKSHTTIPSINIQSYAPSWITKNIPSTEEEVSWESKRVAKPLASNNYPAKFIHNGCKLNGQQEMNKTD